MRSTTGISLVIVDNHATARRKLKSILKTCDAVVVLGEARNCDEAVRRCQHLQPDIVLMDMVLPDASGCTLIELLHHLSPETRPLVLSAFWSEELVNAAFKAGALGYLIKGKVSRDDLVQAIHTTMSRHPRSSSTYQSKPALASA